MHATHADSVGTGDIVVVGSANLDLVHRVPRIPRPGETLLVTGVREHEGGKGNNQVIAAARAGARATFLASVGTDAAGDRIAGALAATGVTGLLRRVDAPTGTALITVDDAGENTILVNSGANALLTGLTHTEREAIGAAHTLLLQLEIPLGTVCHAAAVAQDAGTLVVLNAAPVRDLPDALLELVDVLVVNEHEARMLAGAPANATREQLAAGLLRRVRAVVITLGPGGALASERGGAPAWIAAREVVAVDSTGAGDTFCGALVAAMASGARLVDACEFASIAAAISVTREGAVPSIPTRDEIERFRVEPA